jgi:hypothetical protein
MSIDDDPIYAYVQITFLSQFGYELLVGQVEFMQHGFEGNRAVHRACV